MRTSNIELYRIVCMLMIVAHHYVVNSGVLGMVEGFPLTGSFLLVFGMWGKTAINCFLMITGYFMCLKQISLRKFLKLLLEYMFYKIVIYLLFLMTGRETLSSSRILETLMPVWNFKDNFTSCFLAFYLFIPFINIMVRNMKKREHRYLLLLFFTCYSVLGTIPGFEVRFNYISWFAVIYLMAAYVRMYPAPYFNKAHLWGKITLLFAIGAMLSVFVMNGLGKISYYFVFDANKPYPVILAFSSFLWFKNMQVTYSNWVNRIGASTFGILLIHANSDAMRQWLWYDLADVSGHVSMPLFHFAAYSLAIVLMVFFSCSFLDRMRLRLIETPIFNWYEKKFNRNESFVTRLKGFE